MIDIARARTGEREKRNDPADATDTFRLTIDTQKHFSYQQSQSRTMMMNTILLQSIVFETLLMLLSPVNLARIPGAGL